MVPSADWWVPSPNIKQNTGQTVNHAADLKVMHTATDPVDQPCADADPNPNSNPDPDPDPNADPDPHPYPYPDPDPDPDPGPRPGATTPTAT